MGQARAPAPPTAAAEGWEVFPARKLLCLEAAAGTAAHQHLTKLHWTAARPLLSTQTGLREGMVTPQGCDSPLADSDRRRQPWSG